MNERQQHRGTATKTQGLGPLVKDAQSDASAADSRMRHCDAHTGTTDAQEAASLSPKSGAENTDGSTQTPQKKVSRGLSKEIPTTILQTLICERALLLANRFRVIRTIDVAVACFAERPFKAALTAAQRAMRGMVKGKLLKRYRTDRFQTVYGPVSYTHLTLPTTPYV